MMLFKKKHLFVLCLFSVLIILFCSMMNPKDSVSVPLTVNPEITIKKITYKEYKTHNQLEFGTKYEDYDYYSVYIKDSGCSEKFPLEYMYYIVINKKKEIQADFTCGFFLKNHKTYSYSLPIHYFDLISDKLIIKFMIKEMYILNNYSIIARENIDYGFVGSVDFDSSKIINIQRWYLP